MKLLMESWRKYLFESDVGRLAKELGEEYGVELWMHERFKGDEYVPPIVSLESIVVPKEKRGTGIGSKITRLKKFYKRFGFVPNKGRKKEYRTRDAFIRYPK